MSTSRGWGGGVKRVRKDNPPPPHSQERPASEGQRCSIKPNSCIFSSFVLAVCGRSTRMPLVNKYHIGNSSARRRDRFYTSRSFEGGCDRCHNSSKPPSLSA